MVLGESFFGEWVGILAHEQQQGRYFWAGKAFIVWISESRFIMLQSETWLKKGLKPHRLARRIEVWESITQQEATDTLGQKLRRADHVRVFDEVTGGLSDNSSPMRLDREHLSLAELSWILASDPPLSELYLEALRILASCITPDTLCIFCQKSFAFFVFGIHLPSSWLPCPTSSHPDSG